MSNEKIKKNKKQNQSRDGSNRKSVNNKTKAGKKCSPKVKQSKEVAVRINHDVLRDKDRLEKEYLQRKKEEEMMATEKNIAEKTNVEVKNERLVQEQNIAEENIQSNTIEQRRDNSTPNNSSGEVEVEGKKPSVGKIDTQKLAESVKSVKKESKKDKRPSIIELKDKSEMFKKIIDIAFVYEKVEEERKKLKEKNKALTEANIGLQEEKENLTENLTALELLCKKKQEEIDQLQAEIVHRNEVIDIVKADKTESAQEFKNALAAALKNSFIDFDELKAMEMSDDVGEAVVETLDNVFKILEKNGICINK